MKNTLNFFWFRRDLRLEDHAGLHHALRSGKKVQCVFIFDKNILESLEDKKDARVLFIHKQITKLNKQLKGLGSKLLVAYDTPMGAWKKWCIEFPISKVFTNTDYEPYATQRDSDLAAFFIKNNIEFLPSKDHVIFEKNEITKDDNKPYTVFTPYKNKWLKALNPIHYKTFSIKEYVNQFTNLDFPDSIPTLTQMGFEVFEFEFPETTVVDSILKNYGTQRDFPAIDGTSRLSLHLRFGTVSIRQLVKRAIQLKSEIWLNELIWRDFYQMILWQFPFVTQRAFKPAYDRIPWRNNEEEFHKWCKGQTGYPIVDAGMRELNATGFMHNRVRMITASFLTKHLLIDWRWGEAYFARNLLDFDLASNNGGWQWAAGSGCDAAPYFRIFNPAEQTRKFDAKLEYIRKWVPEFEDFSYAKPIVDHKFARERCLSVYKKALMIEK